MLKIYLACKISFLPSLIHKAACILAATTKNELINIIWQIFPQSMLQVSLFHSRSIFDWWCIKLETIHQSIWDKKSYLLQIIIKFYLFWLYHCSLKPDIDFRNILMCLPVIYIAWLKLALFLIALTKRNLKIAGLSQHQCSV